MARNKILDELHAARAKLLEDAGGDLNRPIWPRSPSGCGAV